jgi:hypothetical protein
VLFVFFVVASKVDTHGSKPEPEKTAWIPAFAGMTNDLSDERPFRETAMTGVHNTVGDGTMRYEVCRKPTSPVWETFFTVSIRN